MSLLPCPKCGSEKVAHKSNMCETSRNGWGCRIECVDCGFAPPKSKWQYFSFAIAVEIWNKYRRKEAD